jgi:hypothetical protein
MLRRLIAASLALWLAVPASAFAVGGCTMDEPVLAAEQCECCTGPMTLPSTCGSAAPGCGCTLRADAGSQPLSASVAKVPSVSFSIDQALIPAHLSTPRRVQRVVAMAASPPGTGAFVERPLLCSWII